MKELTYPFDAESILAKKRKLRRQLLESGWPFIDKRIAILGGSTTSDIRLMLELFLLSRLNQRFYAYAQTHDNFHICDINYISADYDLRVWSDPFYWHMYKYALNVNAIAGLNHPDSALRPEDFIVVKANWEPKDRNFAAIASELNLLPESLVFVDDNPAERHIVTEQLKGVAAPDIGRVTDYIPMLDRSGFFEVTSFSADDLKRNEMYRENAQRAQLQASFTDYRDYLLPLEMRGVIRRFEPLYMARIAQLTNKSNQFNLTTKRYTQAEIEAVAADEKYIPLYGKLIDRFGDNGVVSVVIGRVGGEDCHIDLWLMSCRVLKRDMEFAMMDALVRACQQRGVKRIHGYYYPTAKNGMVREFYALQGFEKVQEDDAGSTTWLFEIPNDYINKNTVIEVEE